RRARDRLGRRGREDAAGRGGHRRADPRIRRTRHRRDRHLRSRGAAVRHQGPAAARAGDLRVRRRPCRLPRSRHLPPIEAPTPGQIRREDTVVERYVMSIDQGTTSTRCIVFDHAGRLVSVAQREHRQLFPRPGWVEHDAVEIWRNLQRIAPQALAQAGVGPEQIAAVGIANQRETTVMWDRHTGVPVAPAIVWQDTRTDTLVDELARRPDAHVVKQRCGLPLATYFSAPTICWMLTHIPGLRERAERGDVLFGTMESWLIWNLTGGPDGGVHVTDVTNASRTLLMNIHTLEWDDTLLEFFGVPRAMLPRIRPSVQTYGVARRVVPGVRIAAALGDQQAALFGQTCFSRGEAKCTYGTGGFLLLNTGTEPIGSTHGLLTTVGYKVDDEPAVYALEGS